MVFHAAEKENRQLKELPQAYTENACICAIGGNMVARKQE